MENVFIFLLPLTSFLLIRSILITGCSTGIGHAACELFAERGWKVFAGSRNPDVLQFRNITIIPTKIDVGDGISINRCFEQLNNDGVNLDCVVNNAGYGLLLPFEDTPPEEIRKMFDANVFGLMEVSRRAAKMMRERKSGTIINISSVLGLIGIPWYAAYSASKWAVEGFSESLAHELRPFNVHVKIVEPGNTRTEFHHTAYESIHPQIQSAYREQYEQKRKAHDKHVDSYDPPENIAELILMAATDNAWRLRYCARQAKRVLFWQRILGRDGLWRRLMKRIG